MSIEEARRQIGEAPPNRLAPQEPVPLKEPQVPEPYRDATGRKIQEDLAKEGVQGLGQSFVQKEAGVPTPFPGLPGNLTPQPDSPRSSDQC